MHQGLFLLLNWQKLLMPKPNNPKRDRVPISDFDIGTRSLFGR